MLGDVGFKFGAILVLVFAEVTLLVLLATTAVARFVPLWSEPRILGALDSGATQRLLQVLTPRAQELRTHAYALDAETRRCERLRTAQ